jgi:hypothetical protein
VFFAVQQLVDECACTGDSVAASEHYDNER